MNAVPLESNESNIEESLNIPSQNYNESTLALPFKHSFKLACLNIASLTAHIDELRAFLANNHIDILSINETKLDETIRDCGVNISGHDIVRRDRNRNGGRVFFFVKKSINFSIRNDLKMDELENLSLEIRKPRSKSFIVTTWYRPPGSLTGVFFP